MLARHSIIAFALVSACAPAAPGAGFVRCGELTCQPGLYCAAPSTCLPGCASSANCAPSEVCSGDGPIGACRARSTPTSMDAGATTTVETDAGSSVARDGGASEPDSGSTPPEPVCGDLRCQGDESSATCPRDCPLARKASCTAACDQIRLCNPTISRNEVNLCFRSCGVATDSQIDRFVACTADSCSPDCLIGGLWECGDGRCEAFEPFIPSEVECPADCGESAVGFDCLIRCEAYALNGCVPDSVDRDCRIHCFESTEPERRRFLACGSPNDPRECAERTCLDDFGVVCPDGSCGECGDGRCGAHESFSLCPADCAPICGDGLCAVEEICRCEADCGACVPPPSCGDGACGVGESCTSCADDCGVPTGGDALAGLGSRPSPRLSARRSLRRSPRPRWARGNPRGPSTRWRRW